MSRSTRSGMQGTQWMQTWVLRNVGTSGVKGQASKFSWDLHFRLSVWSDRSARHPGSSVGLIPWRWSNRKYLLPTSEGSPVRDSESACCSTHFYTPIANCSSVIKEKCFIFIYKKGWKLQMKNIATLNTTVYELSSVLQKWTCLWS